MNPDAFAADLHRKPEVLSRLAAALDAGNPWAEVIPADTERVVLIGMGSSAYAGGVAAARMRSRGLIVTSESGLVALLPRWGARNTVVATSASGGSVETLDALDPAARDGPHRRTDQRHRLGDHRSAATPSSTWPPSPR